MANSYQFDPKYVKRHQKINDKQRIDMLEKKLMVYEKMMEILKKSTIKKEAKDE